MQQLCSSTLGAWVHLDFLTELPALWISERKRLKYKLKKRENFEVIWKMSQNYRINKLDKTYKENNFTQKTPKKQTNLSYRLNNHYLSIIIIIYLIGSWQKLWNIPTNLNPSFHPTNELLKLFLLKLMLWQN